MRQPYLTRAQPRLARGGWGTHLRALLWGVALSLTLALVWSGWRQARSVTSTAPLSTERVSLATQTEGLSLSETPAARLITLRATPSAQADLPALKGLLQDSLQLVEQRFGLRFERGLTLTLCDDPESMRALAQRERGWAPPEWANGLAYPKERVIYLHRDHREGLARTLRHELAHIALADMKALPLWMNEGLAVWASEQVSFERMKTLAQARLSGALLPISSLTRRFPSSPSLAQLAYAQSAHFVTSLADEYGEEPLRETLRGLARGEGLEETLHQHLGHDLRSLEGRWRSALTHGQLEGLSSLAQEGIPMAIGLVTTLLIGLGLGFSSLIRGWWSGSRLKQSAPAPRREQLIGVKIRRPPPED